MSEKPQLSIVPRLPQEQARQDAIEALEMMLEDARKGEIIAVAIVGLRPDDTAASVISGCTKPLTPLGALDVLHHRMRHASLDGE